MLGLPRATRLAARIADGVMLQPFLRICIPVVAACELDEAESLAITKARTVTYVQIPSFARGYVQLNGWDDGPVHAVCNHPMFSAIDRATVDQVFHREQLLAPAQLNPDEIALYGSSPEENRTLIAAWRAHQAVSA